MVAIRKQKISPFLYQDVAFTVPKHRPFFYASFVATVDGKVWVDKKGYWPIGSNLDYQTFTFLRAHADAIIDGRNTALVFGRKTIETLHSPLFQSLRKKLGKKKDMRYFIVSSGTKKDFPRVFKNPYGFTPELFLGSISSLVSYLHREKLRCVFLDGGARLVTSFLAKGFLDELFLTIAPKFFGNRNNLAITIGEGTLFKPPRLRMLKLVSAASVGNEIYLRYKIDLNP